MARFVLLYVSVIVGTLRMLPLPGHRLEVLDILRSVQGTVLSQPGCAGYHIYEEQDPEAAVVLVDRWESEAALDAHLQSEAYRRILCALELSGSPPEVRFERVSGTEGMERIERARKPVGTKGC